MSSSGPDFRQPLTAEQKRVLDFIVLYIKEHSMPPTIRDISTAFGYKSINSARQHLRLIEQKGHIRCTPGIARGIEVVDNKQQASDPIKAIANVREVPIIGTVAAGAPITAEENHSGTISVDGDLFNEDKLFTLRIRGDSMKDIGVFNGDYVIVRQQDNANDGDVVVAIIEGDATLKRFFRRNGNVVLHPENSAYSDIVIGSDQQLWIAGKMVGVLRKC